MRRLQGLSETDPLTGLANRRKIQELLARVQAQAQRYGSHFSLAMLDLDGFKQLNDTYGHPAGDAVLRQVAEVLREQTRAADIVGRYGGDEFLLVLPETAADEAAVLAEQAARGARRRSLRDAETGERVAAPHELRHRRLSAGRSRRQRADRRRRRPPVRLQATAAVTPSRTAVMP